MNISTISTGFQPAKAYNTVNFKGIQKTAAQLANTGNMQKTANKTGKAGQFFSKTANTIGNVCSKIFSAVKKAATSVFNFVLKGVHTVFNAIKSAGEKVSETVSNLFKGIKNKKRIAINQNSKNNVNTIIQTGNNKTSKNTSSISVKSGNIVVINGKTYKYDGKLPDGIKIKPGGSLSIEGLNKIGDLSRKIQDFARTVEENGTLI